MSKTKHSIVFELLLLWALLCVPVAVAVRACFGASGVPVFLVAIAILAVLIFVVPRKEGHS